MIKILANDGIDTAGKKILDKAGFEAAGTADSTRYTGA